MDSVRDGHYLLLTGTEDYLPAGLSRLAVPGGNYLDVAALSTLTKAGLPQGNWGLIGITSTGSGLIRLDHVIAWLSTGASTATDLNRAISQAQGRTHLMAPSASSPDLGERRRPQFGFWLV